MHVFITGGTRGIGNGLVTEFLKKNVQVSFTGTSESSINKVKDQFQGDFLPIICDVRDKSQIEKALEQAISKYGSIDIWINNAGVDQNRQDVGDLEESEIRKVIDVNVTGMIIATSVAINQLKKQGYGRIYNMEGLGSNNMVIPKTVIYGSSKRLLTYFSKGCNKELKAFKDIYVGTMMPGMVFTDLLMNNMDETGLKVAKILGNEVTVVTPYLVKKALQGKKHIKFSSYGTALVRLITMPFKRKSK